ncbi:sensor histidine kinase [Falsiroseomonas sp. E2-1-a20]|uniref:sensor histidine kinase n=1 Tax=Falsiroseomonas sp. E2-1-a20 TaxID=3239300 RepID=UPI003F406FA2
MALEEAREVVRDLVSQRDGALAEVQALHTLLNGERATVAHRIALAEEVAAASASIQAHETEAEALQIALDELQVTAEELEASNAALASANTGLKATLAERKRVENALRDSESRWRGVFEHMHEGFALCEVDGPAGDEGSDFRYLEVNGAWERLTGVPASATVGRTAREIFPGIEDFWGHTYRRVVETGEPAHIEHHLGNRWYEVLAYRTGAGRFAALFMNVTDRRASDARQDALVELGDQLRDLRDASEIAPAAADLIGRTLGVSRAGYGTLDASEETIRIDRDWTDGSLPSLAGVHHPMSAYWPGYLDELRSGEAVIIEDVTLDPRSAERAAAHSAIGVQAQILIPVVHAGRITALLYVHSASPRRWSTGETAFARASMERAWAAAERARAEERRALLVNELNHRVKNTLAVVQSIAAQTARNAVDVPAFSSAFQSRLIALALAHDLLTREDWTGAPLNAVVRAALTPLALDDGRVDLSGCSGHIVLPPAEALALTLAMHELATNAVKHGALSSVNGRVSVTCRTTHHSDGNPVVEWVERGGPQIDVSPSRKGFGLRLLQRSLQGKEGLAADLRFEREGLRCTLRLAPRPVPHSKSKN